MTGVGVRDNGLIEHGEKKQEDGQIDILGLTDL